MEIGPIVEALNQVSKDREVWEKMQQTDRAATQEESTEDMRAYNAYLESRSTARLWLVRAGLQRHLADRLLTALFGSIYSGGY